MPLDPNLITEKNKLETANAWLVFLEIFIDVSTTIRLVNNTSDVTSFQGNPYTAFPFEFTGLSQNATGTIVTVDLKVSNVTRELYPYLKLYQGLVGKSVRIYFVNSGYLSADYSTLTYDFDIVDVDYNENDIIFKIGAPNPLYKKFPKRIFLADWCGFDYASLECGHSGNPCNKTLSSCRDRNNSDHYGGFMGLSRAGVRVV